MLKQTKNDGFSVRATAALAPYLAWAKVGFINSHSASQLDWQLAHTRWIAAQVLVEMSSAHPVQASQMLGVAGCQVQDKQT